MRKTLTILAWTTALLAVGGAGVLAAILCTIVLSMDPTQMVTAGTEPWFEALRAVVGFLAIVVGTLVGLRLWHSERLRVVGGLIVAAAFLCVIWAASYVYAEYF